MESTTGVYRGYIGGCIWFYRVFSGIYNDILPNGSMYLHSIYLGPNVPIKEPLWTQSIHWIGTWTLWVGVIWVAVKGLKLSYYIGETLLFTVYNHYGN